MIGMRTNKVVKYY